MSVAQHADPAQWRITLDDAEQVSVVLEPATGGEAATLYVCAHGAGGHMNDRSMRAVSAELRRHGASILRFNFPFSERKSRRPDPMPRLKAVYAAVVADVRAALSPAQLIIGGRSMGGRVASLLVADGFDCDALLLLAYPLHPAGQPNKLRDEHLPRIEVPVLCINGTRDALCEVELMQRTLGQLPHPWTMHWLEGADHSFHVLKSSGRSDAEVMTEVGEAFAQWRSQLRID